MVINWLLKLPEKKSWYSENQFNDLAQTEIQLGIKTFLFPPQNPPELFESGAGTKIDFIGERNYAPDFLTSPAIWSLFAFLFLIIVHRRRCGLLSRSYSLAAPYSMSLLAVHMILRCDRCCCWSTIFLHFPRRRRGKFSMLRRRLSDKFKPPRSQAICLIGATDASDLSCFCVTMLIARPHIARWRRVAWHYKLSPDDLFVARL